MTLVTQRCIFKLYRFPVQIMVVLVADNYCPMAPFTGYHHMVKFWRILTGTSIITGSINPTTGLISGNVG